jgi:hypothetical protein
VLHCSKHCVPAKLLAGDQYANIARRVAFRASGKIRAVARTEQVGLSAITCRPSGRDLDRRSHQDYPRYDCDTESATTEASVNQPSLDTENSAADKTVANPEYYEFA